MFIVFCVLHYTLYIILFSEKELNIDVKIQDLKKEDNTNTDYYKLATSGHRLKSGCLYENFSHCFSNKVAILYYCRWPDLCKLY